MVEKALWKNEKLTRHDLGREAFVEKVRRYHLQHTSWTEGHTLCAMEELSV